MNFQIPDILSNDFQRARNKNQGTRIKEQGSRVKGKVSLFISIDRGLRVKAFGVAGAELFDVQGKDSLQVIANGVGGLGQVPGDIAQLFSERLPLQRMALSEVLFDQVDGLARFSGWYIFLFHSQSDIPELRQRHFQGPNCNSADLKQGQLQA